MLERLGAQGHPVRAALRQAELPTQPPHGPDKMKSDDHRFGVDRSETNAALTAFAGHHCHVAHVFQLGAVGLIGEREYSATGCTDLLRQTEACDLAKRPDAAAIDLGLDRMGGILDQRDTKLVTP